MAQVDFKHISKTLVFFKRGVWSKIFERTNLKTLRFKRSRNKLRKIKLQDSVLMSKKRYGTRSVYVFLK
jgi:hypothetical protein